LRSELVGLYGTIFEIRRRMEKEEARGKTKNEG
jgi:hypothetical protein